MQIIRGSSSIAESQRPCAVGIGIFDGVHRGHQALLRKVIGAAAREGLESFAYTFDPHPATVLNPVIAPKLIEPIDLRLERLASLGLAGTIVEPFTKEFATTSAEAFAGEILARRLKARHVVVGADFTFGAGRSGNVEVLAKFGETLGYSVEALDIVRADGIAVSSTKIREFVWAGAMRGATLLLGRPYLLTGVVSRGVGRGTRLGFATANLRTMNELVPAVGVYAARAQGPSGSFLTVVNIGFSPTFGEGPLRIEAHLVEYRGGPLYGTPLALEFVDRIRDERRFATVEALREQIAADIEAAREALAAAGLKPEGPTSAV